MDNNSSASESAMSESQPRLEFVEKIFSLKMINAKDDSTTKGGTNIDAIFVRNIFKITCKNFISYFSYKVL